MALEKKLVLAVAFSLGTLVGVTAAVSAAASLANSADKMFAHVER